MDHRKGDVARFLPFFIASRITSSVRLSWFVQQNRRVFVDEGHYTIGPQKGSIVVFSSPVLESDDDCERTIASAYQNISYSLCGFPSEIQEN